ncbi:MAG: hypothetical protein JST48_14670 [Bacteroidetes bacterium]|nr:hypothetical protein [Bacteroidota bacterium]
MDLLNFTKRNFERPSDCRNIDQIRFYISELCSKIEEFERNHNCAPDWAYALLAQYNNRHNQILSVRFAKFYTP